jgi:hypothetical protein
MQIAAPVRQARPHSSRLRGLRITSPSPAPAPPPPPAPPEPDAPGHAPAGRTAAPALPADVVLDAVDRDQVDDFDTVYAAQKRRLYGIAYSVLRDAGEAEDAVQETMWRAWRSWRTLREPAKREAWLTRICLNQCFRAKAHPGSGHRFRIPTRTRTPRPLVGDPLMRSGPAPSRSPPTWTSTGPTALPVKQRAAVLALPPRLHGGAVRRAHGLSQWDGPRTCNRRSPAARVG